MPTPTLAETRETSGQDVVTSCHFPHHLLNLERLQSNDVQYCPMDDMDDMDDDVGDMNDHVEATESELDNGSTRVRLAERQCSLRWKSAQLQAIENTETVSWLCSWWDGSILGPLLSQVARQFGSISGGVGSGSESET